SRVGRVDRRRTDPHRGQRGTAGRPDPGTLRQDQGRSRKRSAGLLRRQSLIPLSFEEKRHAVLRRCFLHHRHHRRGIGLRRHRRRRRGDREDPVLRVPDPGAAVHPERRLQEKIGRMGQLAAAAALSTRNATRRTTMQLRKLIVATAMGAGAVFGTAVQAQSDAPKQSVGEYASDAVITTKVKAAFVADKTLSALDIAVETNNGTVTLTGTVGTEAE